MKYRAIFFILIAASVAGHAQNCTRIFREGNVILKADTTVFILSAYSDSLAKKKLTVSGFRVQLASGTIRKNVLETKAQFNALFPDVKAYIEYMQPAFKLRVGDFESRFGAYSFQQQILSFFPGAFIVPAQISIPKQ